MLESHPSGKHGAIVPVEQSHPSNGHEKLYNGIARRNAATGFPMEVTYRVARLRIFPVREEFHLDCRIVHALGMRPVDLGRCRGLHDTLHRVAGYARRPCDVPLAEAEMLQPECKLPHNCTLPIQTHLHQWRIYLLWKHEHRRENDRNAVGERLYL